MSGWIEEELRSLSLNDKRLEERAKKMLDMIEGRMGESIPTIFKNKASTEAAYRFFNNEKTSKDKIMHAHETTIKQRLEGQSVVLSVQDTTSLDYTTKKSGKQLGHIEATTRRGLMFHPTLLLTPERVNLGLISSITWSRDINKMGQRNEPRRQRNIPIEEKESIHWINGQQATIELAGDFPDTQFVCIGDRENDIYESFLQIADAPDNVDILVRCLYNRKLLNDTEMGKSIDAVSNSKLLGTTTIEVPPKPGRKGRSATLELRAVKVQLMGARRKGGKLPSLEMHVVQALETKVEDGESPICWNLMTSLSISTKEDVLRMVEYYRCRWEIEVYFKILKSGCRVEELQLEERSRLETALALYMILA